MSAAVLQQTSLWVSHHQCPLPTLIRAIWLCIALHLYLSVCFNNIYPPLEFLILRGNLEPFRGLNQENKQQAVNHGNSASEGHIITLSNDTNLFHSSNLIPVEKINIPNFMVIKTRKKNY